MKTWRLVSVWILTTTLTSSVYAQQWKFLPEKNGVKLALVAEPPKKGKSSTLLILQCRPGKNGTMSILYRVNDTKKIAGFSFKDFDGLDAPGSKETLFSIKVDSTTVNTTVGGWYVVDDDFLFSFTALHGRNPDMKRLLEALLSRANNITVQVRDPHNPKKTLQTSFPAPDANGLKRSLQGCQ
jgi:hypothetical protein